MRYGDQVSIGRVDGDLDMLCELSGTYDLVIERG